MTQIKLYQFTQLVNKYSFKILKSNKVQLFIHLFITDYNYLFWSQLYGRKNEEYKEMTRAITEDKFVALSSGLEDKPYRFVNNLSIVNDDNNLELNIFVN